VLRMKVFAKFELWCFD